MADNKIKILKIGTNPLKWLIPEISGNAPLPRYLHSMNYYEDLKIIIIYGGRNDDLNLTLEFDCLNIMEGGMFLDIHVLDLVQMAWISVEIVNEMKFGKCAHASTIVDTSLIIFGGYNFNSYCNSDIYILELDQQKVYDFIKNDNSNAYSNKNYVFANEIDLQIIKELNSPIQFKEKEIKSFPKIKIFDETLHNDYNFKNKFNSYLPNINNENLKKEDFFNEKNENNKKMQDKHDKNLKKNKYKEYYFKKQKIE